MRYRVLGTTHAFRDDGTPVAVGGARLRALLAALALRPGRTVPVSVLVGEVWDGDPPADGVAALQALIGRLRRTLGRAAVESADGGYRLCATEDDVDAYRFSHLAAEGTQALAAGDPVKASVSLAQALALWQGPALADLPDRASEVARWETRHEEARRAHLAALLALGRADEVLAEAMALCEESPLDERVQALRIRALRDAGRPAAALAAYEEVRRALADRLGTDPGPELRVLHTELLTGEDTGGGAGTVPRRVPGVGTPGPATSSAEPSAPRANVRDPAPLADLADLAVPVVPADSADPAALPGRAGLAGRDDAGSAAPDPSAVSGPQVAAPRAPGNLPARLTSFVGRGADIRAIQGDLGTARLVTLLGPGGAGKTRLSQEAAEAGGTPAYPDGVWLAELAPVTDPDTVPEAVLTALGARETVLRGAGAEELRAAAQGPTEPLPRLVEYCERRRMLLVLDNCEHLVGAAAEVAEALLTRCPGLTVLATSREPLGVPGEVLRPVGPLAEGAAFRLFTERGQAVRVGFDPAADPDAVAEICRRLDGLPLAIELAAARLRALTPRQIADRLDDRFRLLSRGSRTVLPRQQTLRAVVDWSWDLLDEGERTVLRRLSVFSGGCGLTAAEAVCGTPKRGDRGEADGAAGVADVADLLGSLVDKSLVVAVPAPGTGAGMRYRLLETAAEYATERLDEAGDRAATERRHLVHYRELARTTDPLLRGAGQRSALDVFGREYENLRTALRRALAVGDEHEVLCLVLSLTWYWQMLDQRNEARHWMASASAMGSDPFAEPAEPAPPIHRRCTDAPPPMPPDVLQEARRQVRMIEMLYADMSVDAWFDQRTDWLRSVAGVYRPGLPQTCRYPGTFWLLTLLFTAEADQLGAALDETVRACERLGYEWDLASVLQMRANIRANRGASAEAAVADADRSLRLFERLGDDWGTAEALSVRGEANERLCRFGPAADDNAAAIAHAESLGAHHHVALLRVRLAQNLMELERGPQAEAILRDILCGQAEDSGRERHVVPMARTFLAVRLGRTGRGQEARDQLRLAREEFTDQAVAIFQGLVTSAESWLDVEDGAFAAAREHSRAALTFTATPVAQLIAPEISAVQLLTAARAVAGLAADGEPSAHDAARLLGAYEALLPAGHIRPPFESEQYEAAEKEILTALGGAAAALAADRAAGAALTLSEAVALV